MWQWNNLVTRDDETGKVTFPTGMCEIMETPDISFYPAEDYPCGGKATHTVTFQTYEPETNTWIDSVENVCDAHTWNESDELHEHLRLTQIAPYTGEYDGQEV